MDHIAWIAILLISILIDLLLSEPPEPLHPTVWMGRFIEFIDSRIPRAVPWIERILGGIMSLLTISLFSAIPLSLMLLPQSNPIVIIVSGLTLKVSFSIRRMEELALEVHRRLMSGDLDGARVALRRIVRRETEDLDREHVISATVETIAEGFVDGFSSAIFYYSLLRIPGAWGYRAINTLDSMVGYKDRRYRYVGWASARLDTIANFIPARISAFIMALSGAILGYDAVRAVRIIKRYRRETESANAGWPISAMAGLLGVRLEKPGHYRLGDAERRLEIDDIRRALSIFKLSSVLFALIVASPILMLVP